MTIVYLPGFLLGLLSLKKVLVSVDGEGFWLHREALASSMMAVHFGKRTMESLFLHKYSGGMPLVSSLFISFFYSILSLSNAHYSTQSPPLSESPQLGILLFIVGTLGNFYHHFLLANLRKPGKRNTEFLVEVALNTLLRLITCLN